MKQIKDRVWEVEAHEERLVELDDWREESGFSIEAQSYDLKELCKQIDTQNNKIMKYTRLDLDMKWKTVDADLKRLQFLRIQALLTWLSEKQVHGWMCDNMRKYLMESCKEYCDVENTAREGRPWVGVERNSDHDLELEMAYSKIRGAFARVKYGRIENKRHKAELQIYKAWLEANWDNLRNSSREQLKRLCNRAEDKVEKGNACMDAYVESLASKTSTVREAKEDLEVARISKRNLMKEVVQTIIHSWKGDGRNLPFVTYEL